MADCRPENINEQAFVYYRRLRRVNRYCSQHFSEDIALRTVADLAALESTYFSKYFHDKVGVCFNCWLSLLRITEAKRLLRTSDCLISTVAVDVGFKNLTSFERAFKRCTGETPSDFKRRDQMLRGLKSKN
jgi:xylan 1,4-beta-xylosidase